MNLESAQTAFGNGTNGLSVDCRSLLCSPIGIKMESGLIDLYMRLEPFSTMFHPGRRPQTEYLTTVIHTYLGT